MPELIEISKSLGKVYKAINAKQRRQNEYFRQLRQLEPRMARAANEFFDLLKKEVYKGTRDLQQGTPAQITRTVADWKALEREGKKIFSGPAASIFVEGSERIINMRVLKDDRTDPIGQAALDYSDDRGAELVTAITEETRAAIQQITAQGIAAGASIQQMTKSIRQIVGLNHRQSMALLRLELQLLGAGLDSAAINAARAAYIKKAIRYRAYMIARTETAYALANGILNGYKKNKVQYVEWVADPSACEICEIENGSIYKIKDARGIPAHPNCECTWVMAVKE